MRRLVASLASGLAAEATLVGLSPARRRLRLGLPPSRPSRGRYDPSWSEAAGTVTERRRSSRGSICARARRRSTVGRAVPPSSPAVPTRVGCIACSPVSTSDADGRRCPDHTKRRSGMSRLEARSMPDSSAMASERGTGTIAESAAWSNGVAGRNCQGRELRRGPG